MANLARAFARVAILSVAVGAVWACKTRSLGTLSDANGTAGALPPYEDFCARSQTEARSSGNAVPDKAGDFLQLWSRPEIEEQIGNWLALISGDLGMPLKQEFLDPNRKVSESRHASSILGAYSTAYLNMTAKRDEERCKSASESEMVSPDPLVNAINHALADLMTRQLVVGSMACLMDGKDLGGYAFEPVSDRWEFCDLYFDTAYRGLRAREYNSLTVAMSSTGIYLSSHISAALSALPFLDRLWVGSAFQGDGRGSDGKGALWLERIEFIEKNYRPAYNAFNAFLSTNLDTVLDALDKDHLRSDGAGAFAEAIEKKVRIFNFFVEIVFKRIREESFETGMAMARSLASNPDVRWQIENALATASGNQASAAPSFHPFLEQASRPGGGTYLEIRRGPAPFHRVLLDLPQVRRSRALTWRLRIDFEALPARALFRSLGAVSYTEGFSLSQTMKKVNGAGGCMARFLTELFSGSHSEATAFSKKAQGLPQTAKEDLGGDWMTGFPEARLQAQKEMNRLKVEPEASASCDMPNGML